MLNEARLVNTETHCDAIDTLLDIHDTNTVGSTTTMAISDMVDYTLALTRLHKASESPSYYEDLFNGQVTFMWL